MSAAGLSRDEFVALARDHTVVPVWRVVLADLETPVSAFVKLAGASEDDPPAFLLESVEHAERWGRFSFLGRDPALTLVARGRSVVFEGPLPSGDIPSDQGALAALEALLHKYRAPVIAELPPFHGGVVGYLGYDVVREIERLPNVPTDTTGMPDAVMSVTGHVTAFDHFRQRLYLIENVFLDDDTSVSAESADAAASDAYDAACARLDARVDELARPLPYVPSPPPAGDLTEVPPHTSTMPGAVYHAAVEAAREHILAGDIFQVVLAQRFDLEGHHDPFDVYRVLRQVNPSPYMYYVRHPEATLVGSSPEPMVQLLDGRVISRPIAGTRRRGRTEADDRRMAAELSEHPKERAEHVMLVDLARNDVGRVVTFGTERMEELMVLERYSHVMHLTSQVAGDLRDGANAVDVLRATFPAGTVSGAPKVRAMEIIDALEPTKRGAYAGVVGYLDFSGNLDTAIAIRTMIWRDGHASVQAGAGIVADSVAEDEDLECHNKAHALLTAAAAARSLAPLGDPGGGVMTTALPPGPLADDLAALRDGHAWVDRNDRGFVTVTGPDTFSFLQALVSADLDPLADGDAVHSLLLAPQGKLDVDFRLLRVSAEEAWLDCAPGFAPQLAVSLTRFRIRVKAEIVDRTGELGMLSWIGDPAVDVTVPADVHRIGTPWGVDFLGPQDSLPAVKAVDPIAYEAWRIEQAIPVQPADVDDTTIPQEAFLEQDAVSFTKGCFIGQELVCRIDSRGHVNRFLRRVADIEGDWPPVGAEIVVDGKVVGALTSVAPPELPTGALGYVRREIEPPSAVELRWDGGSAHAVV